MPSPTTRGAYRAVTMCDAAPTGCILHPVTNADSEPHLHVGEFAVIDTTDRDPIHGELFLIQYQSTDRRCIVETYLRGHECDGVSFTAWWAMPLNRPRSWNDVQRWISERRTLAICDGPYRSGALE